MSVTVLNTTASLSGKTLAKLEDTQTITGLKTFDLGASAPFAVVSGAAVVSNLDADKLDGAHLAALAQLATTNAFTDATDSTSPTTGALKTAGGLGVAKALWVGGLANFAGAVTLQSTLAVTGDIYTTALTDYTATSTITGWSGFTAGRKFIYYKKVGKTVFVLFWLEGTSNATTVSYTLPVAPTGTTYPVIGAMLGYTYDNTAILTTPGRIELAAGATTVNIYKDGATGAWTGSGAKIVGGQCFYETA
jgi:hypothetical protein